MELLVSLIFPHELQQLTGVFKCAAWNKKIYTGNFSLKSKLKPEEYFVLIIFTQSHVIIELSCKEILHLHIFMNPRSVQLQLVLG